VSGEGEGEGHLCGAIVWCAAHLKANAMPSKPPLTRDAARRLRVDQTDAEHRLWSRLRGRQFEGFKFRRQHSIGPFVADFFCLEAKLVVELDGSQHADQLEQDERRTEYIRDAGYAVLRIWNHEVISEIDAVLQRIADALEQSRQGKRGTK
jgi:very-short-patch-repair endonuclease